MPIASRHEVDIALRSLPPCQSVNRFRLKPRGDKWELSQNGSPMGFFSTKEQALSWSIEIVNEVTGSLAIHRADGTIEEERIYPRASDPVK